MTIETGNIIPDATLHVVPFDPKEDITACSRPLPFKIHDKLKGKKVVIFAIPGPFTPTCSETHVPGYLNSYDQLKLKGVDQVICISVIDGFVMNAFAKAYKTNDKIIMAGDGSAELSKALGLTQDLTKAGMGIRSKRFALILDDLKVQYVGVEEGGDVSVSGVDAVLKAL